MITAFCPGHITCFFHPVRSYDPMSAGSRGVGIKLSKGARVSIEERTDGKIVTVMDGQETDCRITKMAIRDIDPEGGYDVTIENDLPVGQGFGMSAAGSIAAALCVCNLRGRSEQDAFRAAHHSEIAGGGGYGDVSGIMGRSHVPVREIAGLPPLGKVIDSGLRLELSVAILGGPLDTGDTLANEDTMRRIQETGSLFVTEFIERPSLKALFSYSGRFSDSIGLETPEIRTALSKLRAEGNAGMCMLGHSIFNELPQKRVSEILGDGVTVIGCQSTDSMPIITRKV